MKIWNTKAHSMIIIALILLIAVIFNIVTFTAIEIEHRETLPRTWSRAVATKDSSYVNGTFTREHISPSIQIADRFEYRTHGDWKGRILPEVWSKWLNDWVPKHSWAHYSDYSFAQSKPIRNGNMWYSRHAKPGRYRLRMDWYESGACNYELWGN